MNDYFSCDLFDRIAEMPGALWLSDNRSLSGSEALSNHLIIKDIKAINPDSPRDGCHIQIETGTDLTAHGEEEVTSAIDRGRTSKMKSATGHIGKNPLSIGKHFLRMTARRNTMRISTGINSGNEIALRDLASEIFDLPKDKSWENKFFVGDNS
jgi:hypothetical protein